MLPKIYASSTEENKPYAHCWCKNTSERLYKSLFEELMGLCDGHTALYTPDFTAMKYYISVTDREFAMTQLYSVM